MGAAGLKKRCVIFGGGNILDDSRITAALAPEDFIICADSGYGHCARLGLTPHLLVGDFDSIRCEPPETIPRVTYHPEKNYTDLALAIEEAVGRGSDELFITGALGGRLDHTLANLQSLAALSKKGIKAQMTDGRTYITAVTNGKTILSPHKNHYFSLFAFGGSCKGVTIRGAKYLLDRYDLHGDDPRAVSNEFLEEPVEITVELGTLLVLCVPMDQCKNE